MNNNMKKIMALALAAAMTLSACGTATKPAEKPAETPATPSTPAAPVETPAADDGVEPIKDLVLARVATRELDTFNYLYSQSASNGENLTAM